MKSGETSWQGNFGATKLRGKDHILMRMEEGELDWLDFDQFDPEDPNVVKKLRSIIKK